MKYLLTLLVVVLLIGGPWLVIEAMDALTYPWGQPPIAWPDDPIVTPEPPIVDPGTVQPPLEPGTHNLPNVPDPRSTGGSCANGQCPVPTSQPDANVGQGTRRLFQRRFR